MMPSNSYAQWRIRTAGFTLLELLVVIVIIGLLAAFVAPRYFAQAAASKTQIARVQIDAFEKGLVQFHIDTGHYPSGEAGLVALFVQPPDEANWQGPYLKKAMPADPWQRAYLYRATGREGRDYEIISHGADGEPGGSGDDADVASWD